MLVLPDAEVAFALRRRRDAGCRFERFAIGRAEKRQRPACRGRRGAASRHRNSAACGDSSPHSRIDSHHGLSAPPTPIWFGTISMQQLQSVLRQPIGEADECFLAAEFRIDPGRIDTVVAVRRSRPREKDRRRIDMADAELGEIGHDRARLVEAEVFVELQAICRARRRRREARRLRPQPAAFKRKRRGRLGERSARSGDLAKVERAAGASNWDARDRAPACSADSSRASRPRSERPRVSMACARDSGCCRRAAARRDRRAEARFCSAQRAAQLLFVGVPARRVRAPRDRARRCRMSPADRRRGRATSP